MKRYEKSYDIKKSPIFGLSSKKKLADLLAVEPSTLTDLDSSGLHTQYRIFKDRKTQRLITEPCQELAKVHRKILRLFRRIQPPEYLHSAIRKRSYKSNAEAHLNARRTLKIDLKKFFPSIRFRHIHNFFVHDMQCSADIATILAKLSSVTTKSYGVHLPTGSCISPLLSYWINKNLFDELQGIVISKKCRISLYIDDITISGENATPELLNSIATTIHSYGYGYHKIAYFPNGVSTITGLVVDGDKLKLPHKRSKQIRDLEKKLPKAESVSDQSKILSSLIGRLTEAEQFVPAYSQRKKRLLATYEHLWNGIVRERTRLADLARKRRAVKSVIPVGTK